MSQAEIKRVVQISVVGAVAIALIYLYCFEISPVSIKAFRAFSAGLSAVTLFWVFYFQWGWRWPVLEKLFDKPNLNGTWIGKLITDWKDPDGQGIGARQFVLVVRQTFLRLHVVTFTDTFIARSYAESVWINRQRGIKRLIYLYAHDSTTVGDEGNREGATELRIEGEPPARMIGRYWSNTKTNGSIEVERVSSEHAEAFQDAMQMREEST